VSPCTSVGIGRDGHCHLVPVTTAWRVHKLRMEERPPIWRVAAKILNKQSLTVGERRGVYRILVGKPEGKRPFGSPRRRWEDNINMDFREVGCGV